MVPLTVAPKINRVLPLPQGNHVAKFVKDPIYRTKVIVWKRGALGQSSRSPLLEIEILTTGSFPHDNFIYWIFTKLGHMISLWKGKNPIYFRVIRSKVKVTITINIIFDNRVVYALSKIIFIVSDLDL
jgi:hypothetical protein